MRVSFQVALGLLICCSGTACADGVDGQDGEGGVADSLIFLGERDGGALNLGSSTMAVYADVAGAETEDGDVVFSTGSMLAAGLSFEMDRPGVYHAELNATWGLSLAEETVNAWFVLDCGGGDGAIISEREVRHSLGNAGSSAVQAHTPFTVSSFLEVDAPGTAECLLQYRLEVAGTGDGIIFHGIDGAASATAYWVAE